MAEKSDLKGGDIGGATPNSAPQGVGVIRFALELLRSDEKSAADREAKLAVVKFLAALERDQSEEYARGYREGYAQGFKDAYILRVVDEEGRRDG